MIVKRQLSAVLSLLAIMAPAGPSLACTQEEAITTMRAVSQAKTERLRGTPAQQQQAAQMAVQIASVGRLLAEARFADACAQYASIAKSFGVDLDAYKSQLAPLAGAAPGQCDTVTATRRVNDSYRRFKESVDTSGMQPRERQVLHQRFSRSIDEATKYVQTNPSRACDIVDEVLGEYGVE